tara:strand:- start:936 stop:1547 length:612 start_codon:yes stop_codon:yes gene_type:complete
MSNRVNLENILEYYRSFLNAELTNQGSEMFVPSISCIPIKRCTGMSDITITYTWRFQSTLLMYPLNDAQLESEASIHSFMNTVIVPDLNKNVRHFLPFMMSLCSCSSSCSGRPSGLRAWISYSDDQDVAIVIKKQKRIRSKYSYRTFRFNRDEFIEAYSTKNRNYFVEIFKYCHPHGTVMMRSSLSSKSVVPARALSIYSIFS